jgi:PAS domain S-box-containing protein
MAEGVSVADERGYIVYTNAAEDRMFGYAPGELIGKHVGIQNGYPDDENARRVADAIDSLNTYGSFTGEWRNRRKDGSEFFTRTRISRVDVDRRCYYVCVQEDITESMRREEQLTDILETVNESFLAIDREWRITYANQKVLYRLGRTREEVIGANIWDVTPLGIDTDFYPQYHRVMHERVPVRFEVTMPYGAHLDVRAYPTRDGLSAHIMDITEAKKAQQTVRELAAVAERQRKQLQVVFDNLEQSVLVFDQGGRMIQANSMAAALHGFSSSREMLVSMSALQEMFAVSGADGIPLPFDRWPVARALLGERVVNSELHVTRLDSGKSWIASYNACPVRDEQGTVLQVVVTIHDLTDRVRSAERLKLALAASRMGDWSWDIATDVVTLSRSAAEIFGIPPGPFLTWTKLRELLHSEDREKAHAAVEAALRGKSDYEIEYRVRAGDGWRWVAASGRGLYRSSGEASGMLGVVQDVSARKEAEAALRESEERFRNMANHAPVLVWIADNSKAFTWLNDRWLHFTGRTIAEEAGRGWTEPIHADDRDRCGEVYDTSFDARQEFEMDFRLRRYDGEYRWFLNHGVPLHDPTGKFIGYIGGCVDITDRIQAEKALQRANDELRLANADLEQFAFAAAHDLQEPLRMMTSYTQLLARHFPAAEGAASEYMEHVISAAKRMSLLLQDLLAYTETSRESALPAEPVELNALFDQAVAVLAQTIAEAGAVVTRGDLPVVRGRETNYTQLFQNLLGNALKYRDADKALKIHVSCERRATDWTIRVEDNGIGIDPKYHQQIFGVFKRLHGRSIPGTGMGLAICQRVVERAGGTIWVESQAGAGASFCFTVPRA